MLSKSIKVKKHNGFLKFKMYSEIRSYFRDNYTLDANSGIG